jgi:hypothetical protein
MQGHVSSGISYVSRLVERKIFATTHCVWVQDRTEIVLCEVIFCACQEKSQGIGVKRVEWRKKKRTCWIVSVAWHDLKSRRTGPIGTFQTMSFNLQTLPYLVYNAIQYQILVHNAPWSCLTYRIDVALGFNYQDYIGVCVHNHQRNCDSLGTNAARGLSSAMYTVLNDT